MKKIILTIAILSTFAAAQNPNLGTSGAKFLQIPVSARAAGMAGAFIGTADDPSAVFWNPAGTARISGTGVQFSFVDLYSQFSLNAVALSHAVEDIGTISASVISLSMDKTEITTELQPNGTGRYYDAQDFAMGLSFARNLTTEFSAGVTVKYIHQRIWNESADAFAFDVGTQYRIDFNNLVIAMSMTNFGSEMRYDGEDLNISYLRNDNFPISRLAPARLQASADPLPLHFQVGVAMDLVTSDFFSIRGEIDATHPNDNNERVNAGIEARFVDRLFLRGGYRYNYDDEDFTFGGGLSFPFGESILRVDYAYVNFILLPDLHRYSLSIEF
jgi:opacity protein-like surface antigen